MFGIMTPINGSKEIKHIIKETEGIGVR